MQADWYARNSRRHKARVAGRRIRQRRMNRTQMMEYLARRGCDICGERDPIILEFHHLQNDKQCDVSEMVSKGYSWAAILREIQKCQLLCANDHRRITAKQRSWYRTN
jgi:hypothetical protein